MKTPHQLGKRNTVIFIVIIIAEIGLCFHYIAYGPGPLDNDDTTPITEQWTLY